MKVLLFPCQFRYNIITSCCLITEARTSSTVFNNSGESGQPCLIHNHKEKLHFFLTEDNNSCGFFTRPLLCWGIFLHHYFVEGFYHEWMLYFVKCFFCIYWEDHMVLINVLYHVNWFVNIKQPWSPGINPTWSWWMILLIYYWIWFASTCWQFLHPCSSGILACNSLLYWSPCQDNAGFLEWVW